MDATTFTDLQEGLLFVFGPIFFWMLVLLGAGGVLTAIGSVVLSIVERMTRG